MEPFPEFQGGSDPVRGYFYVSRFRDRFQSGQHAFLIDSDYNIILMDRLVWSDSVTSIIDRVWLGYELFSSPEEAEAWAKMDQIGRFFRSK